MVDKGRLALAGIGAFGIGGVALYVSGFGQFPPVYYRSLMVLAAAAVVMLGHPLAQIGRLPTPVKVGLAAVDLGLFAILAAGMFRFIAIMNELEVGFVSFTPFDVWIGFLSILVLMELTRRVFGLPIVLVTAFALLFFLFGHLMPGFLQHRGFSLERLVEQLWYSFYGIFGLATAVVLDYVLVFVIFGCVLQGTGAGDRLLKIVYAFTGWTRGGPAHAAVCASALFGTMSGSVTANVVGTGNFTIPMIKSRGFRPAFAGAVEAVASSGGQITPPVMGAAAFLMAELTGIPYLVIVVAAIMPALFFYGALFAAVSIEARKRNIQPIPVEERPRLGLSDWLLSIQFVGPILVIVAILVMGRSPAAAGFWATMTALVLAPINPDFRKAPRRMIDSIVNGGIAGSALLVAAGSLGVIIGTMEATGLGLKFANLVLSVGQDNLAGSLVLTMGACLLLGMGMPTLPAYLVIVLVMGPAIVDLGVPLLAIHLFVMYYGVLSNVTPPVALAAYAAAPIAGANPVTIGAVSVRLALIGFIIPFVFVHDPELLIVAGPFDLVTFAAIVVRLAVAIWLLTTALARYDMGPLKPWESVLRGVLAVVALLGGHGADPIVLGASAAGVGLILFHASIHKRQVKLAER